MLDIPHPKTFLFSESLLNINFGVENRCILLCKRGIIMRLEGYT